MKNHHLKAGYSLIELLIYIAVFSALVILVMNVFIVFMSFFNEGRGNRAILESGNVVMDRISREVRGAVAVRDSTSTFGSSFGTLDLDTFDSNNNTTNIKFTVNNGGIDLIRGSTDLGNLLGSNVEVTNLVFRKIITAHSNAIKIEMTLKDKRDPNTLTQNFYNTVILRGGY